MTSLDKKSFFIPILLGIIFFYLVVSLGSLDPQNLSWIFGRFDPPKDYLGWAFYRNTPWGFPIGSNPSYGIDIGSSIVYSDSVPIMAIFFKLLSPLLGTPFQYFGIWLLICFVLQAWFSWKIVSLFSDKVLIVLFGSGLLAFAPPMLWRLDTPSGMQAGLVAHFLILAAIYLSLRPLQHRRILYWALLLSVAALTHFYIFAMVGLLWIANLLDALFSQKQLKPKQVASEFLIVILIVLLVAWQGGYFMIGSAAGVEWGYGFFKLNLLGPINPDGWSFALPNIPIPSTWGEGFNYLGFGAILAIGFGVVSIVLRSFSKKPSSLKEVATALVMHRFLALCLIILLLDALSNNIGIGMKEIQFNIPSSLYTLLSILRSSARMYWPIHYCLVIAAVYLIIKFTPANLATVLLGFLLAIQLIDTSDGWLNIRKSLARDMSAEINSPLLRDPFWQSAAKEYKKIIRIPAGSQTLNWLQFASLAARNNMATNSVYLARIDNRQVDLVNTNLQDIIRNGGYDPSTLYVLEQRFIIPTLASSGPDDMLAHIDGFTVLAPGWLKCKVCPQISEEKILKVKEFRPTNRSQMGFSNQAKDQKSIFYLGNGWSWQEDWGTWSDGAIAVVNIPWPIQTPRNIKLDLKAFVITDKHPTQSVDVLVNGVPYTHLELNKFDNNSLVIPITKEMLTQPFLKVEFKINNPGQPSKLISHNKDQRKLGLGLKSIYFD
jgi:hypothetical protein